jgi:hypothetical protein
MPGGPPIAAAPRCPARRTGDEALPAGASRLISALRDRRPGRFDRRFRRALAASASDGVAEARDLAGRRRRHAGTRRGRAGRLPGLAERRRAFAVCRRELASSRQDGSASQRSFAARRRELAVSPPRRDAIPARGEAMRARGETSRHGGEAVTGRETGSPPAGELEIHVRELSPARVEPSPPLGEASPRAGEPSPRAAKTSEAPTSLRRGDVRQIGTDRASFQGTLFKEALWRPRRSFHPDCGTVGLNRLLGSYPLQQVADPLLNFR